MCCSTRELKLKECPKGLPKVIYSLKRNLLLDATFFVINSNASIELQNGQFHSNDACRRGLHLQVIVNMVAADGRLHHEHFSGEEYQCGTKEI